MTQDNPPTYDVIIAGGGMVGMSMAVSLARAGFRVALIERDSLPQQLESKFDGRVSAISLGSQRILEDIGAWQHMSAYGEPIQDIRVIEGNTPFFLHYDHREVGDEPFGSIIENRYIRYALQKEASTQATLTILDKTSIESIEQQPSLMASISATKT